MSFLSQFSSYDGALPAGVLLPKVRIEPRIFQKFGCLENVSASEFLRVLCRNGVKELGIDKLPNKDVYFDRVKRELALFDELGFADYLLLTWDILYFCKENDIPVGLGRGSAASSLVLFCIGVTGIDPIKHGLFFERFVNKARARRFEKDGIAYLDGSLMCDIDNDIAYEDRQRVIDHLYSKYPDRVASIATFTTLSGKLCIKECVKIVDEDSEDVANSVSDSIPKRFGKVLDFTDAVKESDKFRQWSEQHQKTFSIAQMLEGLIKNTGVHASGIALSLNPISDLVPISQSAHDKPVAGYDMDAISEVMVKVDILGLRTLSVVHDCCRSMGVDWKTIDPNHPSIYAAFQTLTYPKGIFQIEADTNFEVCRKVKPSNLQELSDVIALARPGALAFVDDYVKVKSGDAEIAKRHLVLDKILNDTKGIFIYQESLMKVASEVFGLTLEDAEAIRRACGKKKREEMSKWEHRIYEQATKLGLDRSLADFYWQALNDSADYSFALSHSVSYATLSAITTYLKFNHPHHFFVSLLNMAQNEQNTHDEIRTIAAEMRGFGIKLLPPDLGRSKMDFSIEGSDIRYGLSSIKGVSSKSLEALEKFRTTDTPNKFEVFLSASEAGLNIGILSALIQAGTMEDLRQQRSRTVLEAQAFNLLTDREQRNMMVLGPQFSFNLAEIIKHCVATGAIGDDGKKLFPTKRYETFKRDVAKYQAIYAQNGQYESFANWYFENQLLGYCSNLRLKNILGDDDLCDSEDLPNIEGFSKRRFVGTINEIKKGKSAASGNSYLMIDLQDESGHMKVMLCDNKKYKRCAEYLAKNDNKIPESGDIIVVIGSKSKDGDTVFADDLAVLNQRIYMGLKDLCKTSS